ncbi:unnamed protein product [Amoebophrya sp. A120]|nr:unnamed protein product [Amoebophrya sp. A120]|eukprot:GSA120T00022587001.1
MPGDQAPLAAHPHQLGTATGGPGADFATLLRDTLVAPFLDKVEEVQGDGLLYFVLADIGIGGHGYVFPIDRYSVTRGASGALVRRPAGRVYSVWFFRGDGDLNGGDSPTLQQLQAKWERETDNEPDHVLLGPFRARFDSLENVQRFIENCIVNMIRERAYRGGEEQPEGITKFDEMPLGLFVVDRRTPENHVALLAGPSAYRMPVLGELAGFLKLMDGYQSPPPDGL